MLFEYVAIWGFREDGRDGIIAMVLLTIFFNLPLAFVGIMAIRSYFAAKKKMSHKLREYGEDRILANIERHTLYTYSGFWGDKTYFTDKLIVDPKTAIIDYNEISYMYLSVSSSKTGSVHSLGLELWDGTKLIICNGVKNTQIMQMMQLCFQHNSQIMCGRSKENDATQKKRVADFKNGKKIASRQSEGKVLRTPYEWTPEGEKRANTMAKKVGGIIIMIIAFFLWAMMTIGEIALMYAYPVTSQDVPLLIAFFIGYLVVFGGLFLFGLWLFKKGKADILIIRK